MHEVDPKSEARLTDALRRLAASSPQSAPPEIGDGLVSAFRRHHTRRRRIRKTGLALAICLVLSTTFFFMRDSRKHQPEVTKRPPPPAVAPVKVPEPAPAPKAAAVRLPGPAKKSSAKTTAARPTAAASNRAFLALPAYDPTIPMDELNVVRVRLPEAALWKMGVPVGPNAGTRRMTADFVVSQDGTPYAVRLVQ